MTYWLAIGPPGNWVFSLENGNIWAFSTYYQKAWDSVEKGDIVVCYATRPIKSIIGYCRALDKQRANHPFFPAEVEGKWPLRLKLDPVKVIPQKLWNTSGIPLERKGVTLQRAFQALNTTRAKDIIRQIDKA